MRFLTWLALLLAAALTAAFLTLRPVTPRQGEWTTALHVADFDVAGMPAEFRDKAREELTAEWGLEGKLRSEETRCHAADDLARLTSFGDRPAPTGFEPGECAFTRRASRAGRIDMAGQCRRAQGDYALSFAATGTTSREAIDVELRFEHRFAADGLTATAKWRLLARSAYRGPCRPEEQLSDVL